MKVVRSSEVSWVDALQKGAYSNRRKPLVTDKLSASVWELPAGKKSFPLHSHAVTEEALFVISGKAKVRTPEGLTPIGAGDYVSFPPGGPAHQLINDGPEPLTYLALSVNAVGADIVEYPESDKVAFSVGRPPSGKRAVFKHADHADYFDGDKDAE